MDWKRIAASALLLGEMCIRDSIGAVLEIPRTVVDGQRDDAVILPGGMVQPAGIALVLHAELALGVGALRS